MARVPWLDAGVIMKVLDAGAYGVICPMVNAREDAERLVSSCATRRRGSAPSARRASISRPAPNYGERGRRRIPLLRHDRDAGGLRAVDEIAATPGLDGLYIGPADLTLGLTGRKYRTGFDREEPEMVEAIHHILGGRTRPASARACTTAPPPMRPRRSAGASTSSPCRTTSACSRARRRPASPRSAGCVGEAQPDPDPAARGGLLTMPHVLVAGQIHRAGIDVLRRRPT